MNEGLLQKQVFEYCQHSRILALRINTGKFKGKYKTIRISFPELQDRGCADMLIVIGGKALFLEFKSDLGKIRIDQDAFQHIATTYAHAQYLVVRDFHDAVAAIEGMR